jgi:hypothetical protein
MVDFGPGAPLLPENLSYIKPIIGANGQWESSRIVIPLWYDNQMAAAALVEEFDHHRFYMNPDNQNLSREDSIFQREFEGHLARPKFINSAITEGKWKEPKDCELDKTALNKKAKFENKPPFSYFSPAYDGMRIMNRYYWEDVINLQKAYKEGKLDDYLYFKYFKGNNDWKILKYDENAIYFHPIPLVFPTPIPTKGR